MPVAAADRIENLRTRLRFYSAHAIDVGTIVLATVVNLVAFSVNATGVQTFALGRHAHARSRRDATVGVGKAITTADRIVDLDANVRLCNALPRTAATAHRRLAILPNCALLVIVAGRRGTLADRRHVDAVLRRDAGSGVCISVAAANGNENSRTLTGGNGFTQSLTIAVGESLGAVFGCVAHAVAGALGHARPIGADADPGHRRLTSV